jgi:hypothetical protein
MISWAEHVTHIGEERNVWTVSVGSPKERDRSENSDIDGRVVSEWILGEIRSGGGGV